MTAYYFISDDSFYLDGLKVIFADLAADAIFVNANSFLTSSTLLNVEPGSMVIMAVTSLPLLNRFMRIPGIEQCRLLLLIDIPLSSCQRKVFPLVISKKISVDALTLFIQRKSKTAIDYKYITKERRTLFFWLCCGLSPMILSSTTGIQEQSLSRLRRITLMEFGLASANATGLLICHALLSMNVKSDVPECRQNVTYGDRLTRLLAAHALNIR